MHSVSPFLMPKMKGVINIGRKLKLGIDYYAMSVKHLQELRIDELNSKAGIKGLMIVELFNMAIYENGYYLKFDSIDYLIRLVSKSFYYDRLLNEEIRSIIEVIMECEIFYSELFNKGVLTSNIKYNLTYSFFRVINIHDLRRKMMSTKENKIIDISSRLKAVYKLRIKLMEIYANNLEDYVEANELLLNVEDDLWNEVDGDDENETK